MKRKNRPWPDDTGEIVYGEEKVSVLMLHTYKPFPFLPRCKVSLNSPNFSNTIDSLRWKNLVCLRKARRAVRGVLCESRSELASTAPLRTTNPMSFPCSCHHLHTANPGGLTLHVLQSRPYQSAETLTTHQSTWPCFFYKMVWRLNISVSIFFSFFFLNQRKTSI